MKKLFALIVAICATTLAWADDSGSCGENVTYSFVSSTGTLTISGTGVMKDYYTSDVPWIDYRSSIKKVVINNGVTRIGEWAFDGCTGLTSVTIPNSVTSIGWGAFNGCTGLTSITIPNSVTSIGTYAFNGCTGLTSINVAEDNLNYASIDGVLYSKDKKTLIRVPMTKTSVTIPNSVTSIGTYAFNGCTGLTSITIPNSVTSIGWDAFNGCTGLTSITIPNSVTSIGERAFNGCTGLTSITIPNSVTSIGRGAFNGCTGLTSVTIPNSVTSIGEDAFRNCTGLTSVTIPNSVTSIKDYAFSGCTGLTSVTIPNSVTSIRESAFNGCTGLTSINVAEDNLNYASIDGVLYSKDKKTLIRVPMTKTSVTIPNSVTSIGSNAFLDCTGLTSITIPNSVTSIRESAFDGCTGLTSINIAEDNLNYASIDGVLYNKDKNTLIMCPEGKTESITIPNSVTSIGDGAFSNCTGLTSVTIPNSVTSIGSGTFWYCTGLTSITIGNGVTSIGDYAFYYCTGLTSINIPNSVTSIGDVAFDYCTGLTSINVAEDNLNYASIDGVLYSKDKKTLIKCPGGKTGSITIPNSVTSIGNSAFNGCTGLTSVTIPNSVTSIGERAFEHCIGLTSVTIPNSVTSIGKVAFSSCTGLTSITIGNSVTSIGWVAFSGCTELTSITVEATNPPSSDDIVSNYNIPLYVPAGSVNAYKAADEWKKFTNIQAIPATGVNEAAAEKREVKKIMIDRTVYIEAEGVRYNLNGQKVK